MNKLLLLTFFVFGSAIFQAQVPDCVQCCCGTPIEVGVPGGNFEDPPYANPIIVYFAGQMYSSWTVNSGSIDLLGPNYLNWATGNPNGATQFIDLHGNTPGSFSTILNGLNVDYEYTIVLWYAKNAITPTANCQIQVADGAWLDQTWTATNNGANGWLRKCFTFTALASTADLKFTGTGPVVNGGVLLDDITMYSCPPKSIPAFTDMPDDISGIQCLKDVPPPPMLTVQDDCDNNPSIDYSESTTGTPCNQTITRTWTATNSCGATSSVVQQVFIEDNEAPAFVDEPQDIYVDCSLNIQAEFNQWLNGNGGATATDNCEGNVLWSYEYQNEPEFPCSETEVSFIVSDNCGNENTKTAKFIVEDTEDPVITKQPENIELICDADPYAKLTQWLNNHANATVSDNCSSVTWSNNFDNNYTKTLYTIQFTATDECGNFTTFSATFNIKPGGQTVNLQKTTCDSSQAGIDTLIYNVNGCDSIVITTTLLVLADTLKIFGTTCIKSKALSDTLILQNSMGCDSIVIHQIKYNKPDTTIIENQSCSINNFSVDTLSLQGKYCDSLVLIKNIPLLKDTVYFSKNTCDTTKAGIDTTQYLNQYGCDSIVITELKFSGYLSSELIVHQCGDDPDYLDTIIYKTAECDSFVFIKYIYHKPDSVNQQQGTCDPKLTGTTQYNYKNSLGCDSLVFVTRYLLPSDTVKQYKNTCQKSDAGVFELKYTNQFGCDSIVILTSTLILPDTTYVSATTCDPTLAGISIQIIKTAECDSIVITNTSLLPSYFIKKQNYSCTAQNIATDTTKLLSISGCDSIIVVETIPKPLDVFQLVKPEKCKDSNDGSIVIDSVHNGLPPYQYSINGIDYFPENEFSKLAPGDYTLYIKDNQGCTAEIKNLTIDKGSTFTVELGPDKKVKEGTLIDLIPVYSDTAYQIQWAPASVFSCIACKTNSLIINHDQKIFLYAENQHRCQASDSILLSVIPDIKVYIPNVFSPDLDGINDYFTVYGDHHLVSIKELNIYSRWGEHLFSAKNIEPNNPSLGWNGKTRGKLLDPGVFVYWAVLEFDNGETALYRGELILLR
ncbi:MAG TPA: gliding motility-associated C-terminal domain-containing protein [Saprospiraceae bacterium]|nr:gliding motility-associated C-terminal domain-containing protein [Saprospiraceae bacterium]HMV23086.1 gliding motility-associated C-terminal domain-containing protein [Saprospiraceae bacterium]HMX81683.1 gliding motility-associated C-terminal domain-containing protein [Saprospiraceae bacterium]HMZ72261.1 gliding motility-associated C-terminal domain-containing protein [Saprospiraceae bacterium]HNA41630.1 gliding motility-associated C-terminal domain-containing protein [Saprospiraceae bacteri